MNTIKTGSASYEDNMEAYIKRRKDIIETLKAQCVDATTVARFETNTNKWLKDIENHHKKGKVNEEIDITLSHLLKFAIADGHSPLNRIQSVLDSLQELDKKTSEQEVKSHLNIHGEEIVSQLRNHLPNLSKLAKIEYGVAVHKRK